MYSRALYNILSLIFFTTGSLLLFIPEYAAKITLDVFDIPIIAIIFQFFGTAYIILGLFLYLFRNSRRRYLKMSSILLIHSSINFYLIYQFNEYIVMPNIYFILQFVIIICLILSIFELSRKNKT